VAVNPARSTTATSSGMPTWSAQRTNIDNVRADEFSTSITFWERNPDLLPTRDCVAIVTGEAAFLPNGSGDSPATELALKIRAGQVCV
jgi:hypothetical protein